jgi:hypothetical protein
MKLRSKAQILSFCIFIGLKKMNLKITDNNYSQYKQVFKIVWTHYSKHLPPELLAIPSPYDTLVVWEEKNKSLAKKGLKEGLRDIIYMIQEFPPNLISDINEDLLANNLPNLKALKAALKDTLSIVLKRQKINTIDEFYIVKEYAVDLSNDLTLDTRQLLDKYITEFEMSRTKDGS